MVHLSRLLILSLALGALTLACGDSESTDTTPPVITIVGDNPMVLEEGEAFVDPGATAIDDVDGILPVTVSGTVGARDGAYTITYTATDEAGNVSTATREVTVEFRGQLALATVGADLGLFGIKDDGSITERSRAVISDTFEAYNSNHMAFSITPHPTMQDTVFVTSFNECSGSWEGVTNKGCWGNARIDRYTYGVNTVTHDGLAILLQTPLRFLVPEYDEGTGELTITLLNQSNAPVSITDVATDGLPPDATADSACDGVILQANGRCTITLTSGGTKIDQADLTVTTPDSEFTAEFEQDEDNLVMQYQEWDGPTGLPSCANAQSKTFQIGYCAPTALAFSPDGTRAYVSDDEDDEINVFSVSASGTFTYLNTSDEIYLHGIAVHPNGTALYGGNTSYEIDGDEVNLSLEDEFGNATEVVLNTDGKARLISTLDNSALGIWDVETTPLVPILISEISPAASRARFQHHTPDLSLFVTIDHNAIATITFDGTDLTEVGSLEVPVEPPRCATCNYKAVYRSIQMRSDGHMAGASGFVNPADQLSFDTAPYMGFISTFSLGASTHEPALESTLELDGGARAIRFVDKP